MRKSKKCDKNRKLFYFVGKNFLNLYIKNYMFFIRNNCEGEIEMFLRRCDKCGNSSYSSSEKGEWLCPICGKDLSEHSLYDAITEKPVKFRKRNLKGG